MEFTGSRLQIASINLVAEGIYRKIAQERGYPQSEVHKMGLCWEVSNLLSKNLNGMGGMGFKYHLRRTPKKFEYYHCHGELDNDWRIDLSWQQYLPSGKSWHLLGIYLPDLEKRNPPKVLIVRSKDLPKVLTYWGFPARSYKIWLESERIS